MICDLTSTFHSAERKLGSHTSSMNDLAFTLLNFILCYTLLSLLLNFPLFNYKCDVENRIGTQCRSANYFNLQSQNLLVDVIVDLYTGPATNNTHTTTHLVVVLLQSGVGAGAVLVLVHVQLHLPGPLLHVHT